MEKPVYVAIVGTRERYGTDFIRPGQLIHLTKDPDNRRDHEAIRAEMTSIGQIGYVANSPHTVPRGCRSAGRIYDQFGDHVSAFVRFVVKDTVIAELAPGVHEYHLVAKTGDEVLSAKR